MFGVGAVYGRRLTGLHDGRDKTAADSIVFRAKLDPGPSNELLHAPLGPDFATALLLLSLTWTIGHLVGCATCTRVWASHFCKVGSYEAVRAHRSPC
jgi:hypothetical protein